MLHMATNDSGELVVPARMTIREAADFCHVDYDTVLKWVRCGALPFHVVGPSKLKRVYRSDVLRLIAPGSI